MFYNRKKTIFFIVSLILAIGITGFQYFYFQKDKDSAVEVYVAGTDFKEGEKIGNIKTKSIPKSAFVQSMIEVENEIKGYSNCNINKGSYILREMVEDYKPPVVKKGMRRISITVNLASAIAGKIKPGDFIDVGVVSKDEKGRIVVTNIQIYDVVNSKGSSIENTKKNEYDSDSSIPYVVTLLTTPEQAINIKDMEDKGNLFLMGY